jgi:methylated-DNA-[protein]-cysteine S-methyltransferase
MPYMHMNTLVGPLTVFEDHGAIVAIEWGRAPEPASSPLLAEAKAQLDAYFDRRLRAFDLPLEAAGTAFQKAVWRAMAEIPYGETRTYADIAHAVDSAPRAVGGACGRNPIPIVVPCHRVVGTNGTLTGFSGGDGLATKRALLSLEGFDPG